MAATAKSTTERSRSRTSERSADKRASERDGEKARSGGSSAARGGGSAEAKRSGSGGTKAASGGAAAAKSGGSGAAGGKSGGGASGGAKAASGAAKSGSTGGGARGGTRTNTNMNAEDRKFVEKFGDKLSKSTTRARWIHSPDEHAERPGQTLATRSPEVIRAWAEARGAQPATAGANADLERPRVLRMDFPGFGGRNLQHVDWTAWLNVFEERKLVMIFQERKRDGSDSNFFRLDSPTREDG